MTALASLRRRRSSLLLLVYGASLVLVALTAAALAIVVSGHVTSTAIASTVAADRSLVRGFTATVLEPGDLGSLTPSPERVLAVGAELRNVLNGHAEGLLQLKILSRDGTVLFSNDPGLVGQSDGTNESLDEAVATGGPVTELGPADDGEASTVGIVPGGMVIESYLPILGGGGQVVAVFEIYRNAAPVLAGVDATQRDVSIVTLIASGLLAVLLHLIFQAAQGRLTRQTEALVEAGRRDPLTGLLNHGTAVALLAEELEAARVAGGSVGLALVDLDNFRLLNETHGHAAGDMALREVAKALRQELSIATVLGRFGPDELLVVAPTSCVHDLEPAIERLRDRLVDISLQFGASERLPMTVSVGVCFSPTDGEAATELLAVATLALGEAKASGGNSVRVADAIVDDMRTSERSSFDVLKGLIIAVDTKDRYTKRHSEDVARYALFLADRMSLPADIRRTIGIAGLLHDVGKIGIPDVILRKPASLTADEYEIVKQHVALGDAIVRDLPNLDDVRAGIRHHHERWDGTGYLHGLEGDAIPLVARLLAVADAFSAMTTSRPYRKALSVHEALHRLEDASGSQLDPALVVAFVTGIESAPDAPLPGDHRGISGSRPDGLWIPRERVA
jgi:diguanylate cyclase (GGDEF)-like protein